MRRSVSVAEAKSQLTRLLREAEGGSAVEIRRRGKPVAVLVSLEDFERIQREIPSVLDAWEGAVAEEGPAEAGDAEAFEGLRDATAGRAFEWP